MLRVSNPPSKPLLIWDGDCRFCELWVQRWRVLAGNRADDATFQQVADRFREIPRGQFERAVVYIDTDGKVSTGAEAIFRSVEFRFSRRWLAWSYHHVAGFAGVSEFFYGVVARHRGIGSVITKSLWGNDVRPPGYLATQRWFLRGLGVVYLVAFLSLWLQIDGLVGADGILPVADFLGLARDQVGAGTAISYLPTLCWFDSSNAFLHFLCGGGVVLSLLLVCGFGPIICLVLLFVSYLSLTIAGQTFLSFQWDILLLETGFLAIFFAPATWWMRAQTQAPVPRVGLFLLKLLLFKLMFMSGMVKLTSHDDSWWNLTALDYHYWSQPLPTVFAWFADKHPEWFKEFSVAFCLVVEIIVPFFIWAPRRLRLIAAALLIFLQLVIAITGNYCFFNLLTIVLCLLLIDDRVWQRVGLANPTASRELRPPSSRVITNVQWIAGVIVLVITLPLNAWHIYSAIDPETDAPRLLRLIEERAAPFHTLSGYGLFRVMTKDRREIIIEGSADGIDWLPYEFKWKPGDVNRAPGWCAPHQPRLDWQMWFAALSTARQNRWFLQFVECLLEDKPAVTRLLKKNPFPAGAPRYVRARFYRYRFTTAEERHRTGVWWRREELGEYLPTVPMR